MVTTTLGITCLRAWQTLPRTRQEASQALRPDSLMDAVKLCRCGAEAATEKMKINGCACFDKTLYTDTEIWISCNFLYVTKCYYCFLFPNHLEVETSESWGQVTRRWWKHWKVWNPSAGQPGPNPAGSHPASAPPVNPACSPGLCATPLAAPQGNPASPPGQPAHLVPQPGYPGCQPWGPHPPPAPDTSSFSSSTDSDLIQSLDPSLKPFQFHCPIKFQMHLMLGKISPCVPPPCPASQSLPLLVSPSWLRKMRRVTMG